MFSSICVALGKAAWNDESARQTRSIQEQTHHFVQQERIHQIARRECIRRRLALHVYRIRSDAVLEFSADNDSRQVVQVFFLHSGEFQPLLRILVPGISSKAKLQGLRVGVASE